MKRVIGVTVAAVAAVLTAGLATGTASAATTAASPGVAEHVLSTQTFGPLTVDTSTGDLNKGQVIYYTTSRTITVAGSSIYVNKTDGPGIQVMWYKCGDHSNHGPWKRLANGDPTGYVKLDSGFLKNTHFCLAAWDDQGKNNTDTWTGQIKYNVA
jgi:hypothetical protein